MSMFMHFFFACIVKLSNFEPTFSKLSKIESMLFSDSTVLKLLPIVDLT